MSIFPRNTAIKRLNGFLKMIFRTRNVALYLVYKQRLRFFLNSQMGRDRNIAELLKRLRKAK
ncbi:MAG TPA: hypothetical protein DHW02_01960 [Ktedonobacter sp.]|nr:hypothetical protein [Ktedonobacter sp.]